MFASFLEFNLSVFIRPSPNGSQLLGVDFHFPVVVKGQSAFDSQEDNNTFLLLEHTILGNQLFSIIVEGAQANLFERMALDEAPKERWSSPFGIRERIRCHLRNLLLRILD